MPPYRSLRVAQRCSLPYLIFEITLNRRNSFTESQKNIHKKIRKEVSEAVVPNEIQSVVVEKTNNDSDESSAQTLDSSGNRVIYEKGENGVLKKFFINHDGTKVEID